MDMTMVALPDDLAPQVAVGDVATIFGGRVALDAQAAAAGTIAYELLTALGPRLPRRYHADGLWNLDNA
jgi:alanine racemase